MNKTAIKIFLLTAMVFIFQGTALATGPATVYKVRIAKFELYNGTSWVTVFEGTSSTLDIAAVSAGSAAGNFFSGLTVPDGTYTQVRVTPSPTFTFSGNDGVRYTTATVGLNGGSTPTLVAAAQAECTITLTTAPGTQTTDFSATPITVKEGAADRKVRVSFNVANAVEYNNLAGELYTAAPVVTMSIQ